MAGHVLRCSFRRPLRGGIATGESDRRPARGLLQEYLHGFARAAFAEGIDTGSDAGLRRVVEGAGLRWDEALEHLDNESWRDELEANRRALLEMGLWGVPSFRLRGPAGAPDFCTWGQDRLWRIEQEIRRRLT